MISQKLHPIRIANCNAQPVRTNGHYVLYWMIAFRRTEWNFSLDRALEWAVELNRPLVIFEPLRIGYRWASDRIHRFVIDGMADNAARVASLRNPGVLYYPYVEPAPEAGKDLLEALARHACLIVTDDFPAFFLPRMVKAASDRVNVLLEKVDSNGLLPLRTATRAYETAFSFRAFLQKELPAHLMMSPRANPFARITLPPLRSLPDQILDRWPGALTNLLRGDPTTLALLAIDHAVTALDDRGGPVAATKLLRRFLNHSLTHYAKQANQPDSDARSGLSPYLHFGHISPHLIFYELMKREKWSPDKLHKKSAGKRQGWWNVSPSAEMWLDEFVTWRELGYNMTANRDDYDQYESLPDWSRATLKKHARDRREFVYSLEDFAAANTHDEVWNAAQRQLVREGRIHNYLRMLWGKKILEWTGTPREAIEVMVELNNRFAIDGRDPNSYSGIFWCLGRYDRAWGPERPIFGTVRYMSSENTRRKLHIKEYLRRFGPTADEGSGLERSRAP
jgi:deoxyribodipyrimidine photo-lyase